MGLMCFRCIGKREACPAKPGRRSRMFPQRSPRGHSEPDAGSRSLEPQKVDQWILFLSQFCPHIKHLGEEPSGRA